MALVYHLVTSLSLVRFQRRGQGPGIRDQASGCCNSHAHAYSFAWKSTSESFVFGIAIQSNRRAVVAGSAVLAMAMGVSNAPLERRSSILTPRAPALAR